MSLPIIATGASFSDTGKDKPNTAEPGSSRTSANAILVRRNQKGNPLSDQFRNVPWQYDDVACDYQVGKTTGVIFLSLKYHRLHPEYIFNRIEALEKKYTLRVLLILCDVGDQHEQPIKELTKSCIINELTIIVAWSFEEAAMYLQTYKVYENRPPDSIKERIDKDYSSLLRNSLTTIRGVNKTDVMTLRTHFGSFSGIVHASTQDLLNCPGLGPTKVRRLNDAFNEPFRRRQSATNKDKGKSRETAPIPLREMARPPAPRKVLSNEISLDAISERSQSPPWDIELDLNDDDTPGGPQPPPWEVENQNFASLSVVERDFSPDWVFEEGNDLLEKSLSDELPAKKKRRANPSTEHRQ